MAYSELIKNFDKIRDYMREFYVYGFKKRGEYDRKSARSYDNERRRMESWLGDYMAFRKVQDGKNVFISVDSRSISHNPLFSAFKAKSFTDNDITLHFYILDMLQPGVKMSSHEIIETVHEQYLEVLESEKEIDDSTIRKKLREYEALGLLNGEKQGRELFYSRSEDISGLASWKDAAAFFSEADPMGVTGSYILDKFSEPADMFNFKHHYILHTLDSVVLEEILQGIRERRAVELTVITARMQAETKHTVCPLNILISTQSGRQYLMCYHYKFKRIMIFRLDSIHSAEPGNSEKHYEKYRGYGENFRKNLWGVSHGRDLSTDHIEMTIHAGPSEHFILDRLEREKRCGKVEMLDEETYKFSADVYDASEMLPWIRTFTGRIVRLECSSKYVTERFYADLGQMQKMYGGDGNAVQ